MTQTKNLISKLKPLVLAIATISLLSACGSNQATTVNQTETFVSECGYGYAQKPSSITLTCADAGMYVDEIKFTEWKSDTASGRGIFHMNDCNPDCASGKFISLPVSVTLNKPFRDSNGTFIFSKLKVTSTKALYNDKKIVEFDIGIEQENQDQSNQDSQQQSALTPEEATFDLMSRLNSSDELWEINDAATSSLGQMSHKRLGLYSEPDYVLECNIRMSGTWLFVYSDESSAYDAIASDYFYRTSAYSAEFTYDPDTGLIIILHTSMGGNKTCINSAFQQLDYYATD